MQSGTMAGYGCGFPPALSSTADPFPRSLKTCAPPPAPRVSGAYIADCAHRTSSAARAPLRAGEDPARARRATRLLQAYKLEFWDALAAVAER